MCLYFRKNLKFNSKVVKVKKYEFSISEKKGYKNTLVITLQAPIMAYKVLPNKNGYIYSNRKSKVLTENEKISSTIAKGIHVNSKKYFASEHICEYLKFYNHYYNGYKIDCGCFRTTVKVSKNDFVASGELHEHEVYTKIKLDLPKLKKMFVKEYLKLTGLKCKFEFKLKD